MAQELQGLSAVASAAEIQDDSGDLSKVPVKESAGSRDTSEGTTVNYFDRKVIRLIL